MFFNHKASETNKIRFSELDKFGCQLFMKREDLLHPFISGNKYRKLKYNLVEAVSQQKKTLLTFGGAYSNHIAATAYAGKEYGFKTIGVIRGEELKKKRLNPTLKFAQDCGMQSYFVDRESYRDKYSENFLDELNQQYGDFYILPEGGTNSLAVKGCEEILTNEDKQFDYVCTAVGTGGTLAGLVKSSGAKQTIIGFSALKGTFQTTEVKKYTSKSNFFITDAYCFGGYAKINEHLIHFINKFKDETQIPLDPIYTGKMMFGIIDMLKTQKIPNNSRILAIHTGGLQGIPGMNQKISKMNNPLIPLIK